MRRIAGALMAATMLAILGCDSGPATTNTGPELKPPSEGAPALPPTKK
jgi:hypothetical protein